MVCVFQTKSEGSSTPTTVKISCICFTERHKLYVFYNHQLWGFSSFLKGAFCRKILFSNLIPSLSMHWDGGLPDLQTYKILTQSQCVNI